jgi:hypothetical protein
VVNQFDEVRRWLPSQCNFWQQPSRAVDGMKPSDNGMIRWASLCCRIKRRRSVSRQASAICFAPGRL